MILFRTLLGFVVYFSHAIPTDQVSASLAISEPHKIIAFGTSLTARAEWPAIVESLLESCTQQQVSVRKVAKPGATSSWAVDNVEEVLKEKPDTVLIEFYANDAALNRFMSSETSRTNFSDVLDRLSEYQDNVRVVMIVVSPVFGIRKQIRPFLNTYIEKHLDEIQSRGMEFIDLRPIWDEYSKDELMELIPDGLHPEPGETAKIIGEPVANFLVGQLCDEGRN